MDRTDQQRALETMPARQRECLRLVFDHHNSKEIGRLLQLSEHTVDGHLRKAIERLGVGSRTEAARLLAGFEGGAQRLSTQPVSIATSPESSDAYPAGPERDQVNEERSVFVGFEPRAVLDDQVQRVMPRNGLTGASRVLLMLAGLALTVLVIVAAVPMSEAFQRVADALQPAHH